MGGGHGLAATIRGVRRYAGSTTAVVATADDGGSTGRLRSAKDMPAPGDLRRCLVAMAGIEQLPLGRALEYRFAGTDVEGHALGNLLLKALGEVTGDFTAAVDEVARLLGLDPEVARVLPATVEPVRLRGVTEDGREVVGQVAVSTTEGIARVALDPPDARAPDGLVDAVKAADQVVFGPGSLYTSVLAAAVVEDLRAAVAATAAQRVYVCNLRAEAAETRGYDVVRHVEAVRNHGIDIDVVLVHRPDRGAGGVDLGAGAGVKIVAADVARPHGLAHDSVKLGAALAALISSS
ncbi:MAG TPA: uridine diphosphate-N-acetylglucosamine-binding protein YvcK [Acidimicrobiales bacterium]